MTFIAGFKTQEGIVVVADGRETYLDKSPSKNDITKIFELSPIAVVSSSYANWRYGS